MVKKATSEGSHTPTRATLTCSIIVKQSRMFSSTFLVASLLITLTFLPSITTADYIACGLDFVSCVNSPHASGQWCCPSSATSLTVNSQGIGTCQGSGSCGADSWSSEPFTGTLYRPCAGQLCKTSYPQYTSPGSSPVCCTDAPLVWLSGGYPSYSPTYATAGCRTPQTCASPASSVLLTRLDGGWSPWTCSNTCGYGDETRTCSSPTTSPGGIPCTGEISRPCFSRTSCPQSASTSEWSLARFPNPSCAYDSAVVLQGGSTPCTSIDIFQQSLSVICIDTGDVKFTVTASTNCSPGNAESVTWTAKAGACSSRNIQGVQLSFIARCAGDFISAGDLIKADLLRIQDPDSGDADEDSTTDSESSLSLMAIIAICMGCLVAILVIIFLLVCFCRGSSSSKNSGSVHPQPQNGDAQAPAPAPVCGVTEV